MTKDYSPFTPGQPASNELFVGRKLEVEQLVKMVGASATGRLQMAYLSGERGIGKSSIASFVRRVCEQKHRVLGVHTYLGGVSSLEDMVSRVFNQILKVTHEKKWFDKLKGLFGEHVRQVGLFGIRAEFRPPAADLKRLVHGLPTALQTIADKISDEKTGIMLILDDINGLASAPDFAHWLKSFVDEIATSDMKLPLSLVLVGIEERRQSLISLNPSLARVFDLIEIAPWSKSETKTFFGRAFSSVSIHCTPDATTTLTQFAGGLPVLAHEIGDAVFKVDSDDRIDRDDALLGVLAAADVVGRKYLEPRVFQELRSKRYRTILRKIAAEERGESFKRSDILERLTSSETKVFDNFLKKMREIGVLRYDEEAGRGAYRFQNLLHHLYFMLEAERATERPAD